jgi:hypothetical protein
LSLCLTKHHTMKTYWGSGGIAPRILDLGTRWMWVVSFTLRPLYPQGKGLRYPLGGRLDGSQRCSGHGGEDQNSLEPRSFSPQLSRYTDWAITAKIHPYSQQYPFQTLKTILRIWASFTRYLSSRLNIQASGSWTAGTCALLSASSSMFELISATRRLYKMEENKQRIYFTFVTSSPYIYCSGNHQ